MKKSVVLALALALTFAFTGCGDTSNGNSADNSNAGSSEAGSTDSSSAGSSEAGSTDSSSTGSSEAGSTDSSANENADVKSEGVMTYAEYVAAPLDSEVVIEAYVQAKQSWWEDKATVYTQDKDGAYFLYDMACSQADYDKLIPGTKIKVTGYKSEWSGEVEIIDATFEIVDGDTYIAAANDVTSLLGTDDLINHQNEYVSFKGMTVEPADDNGAAFLYKWDGSGEDGDDLYFNVSLNGNTYTFTVESYLCDNTTDVYAAVKNLQVGDVIDMEGFLYWYEGVNPHITSVTAAQ